MTERMELQLLKHESGVGTEAVGEGVYPLYWERSVFAFADRFAPSALVIKYGGSLRSHAAIDRWRISLTVPSPRWWNKSRRKTVCCWMEPK